MFCVSFVLVHSEWGSSAGENVPLCVHLQGICLQSPPTHRVMYRHTETYRCRDAPVTQKRARSYMKRPLKFFFFFFFQQKESGDSDHFLTCVSDRVEQFGREQREKAELPRPESAIREECRVTFYFWRLGPWQPWFLVMPYFPHWAEEKSGEREREGKTERGQQGMAPTSRKRENVRSGVSSFHECFREVNK